MGIVTDTEVVKTDTADRPTTPVTIRDCGEILPGHPLGVSSLPDEEQVELPLQVCEDDGTPDKFPHHPEDLNLDWYV